jgi:hypothetical protein
MEITELTLLSIKSCDFRSRRSHHTWSSGHCFAHSASCSLQIIGRGNDQVAISSKFETREDIGKLPVGFFVGSKQGHMSGGKVTLP